MGFTLSATAPEFHPNDEEMERSNLSAEELANVREDVFNEVVVVDLVDKSNTTRSSNFKIEETSSMKNDGLKAMKAYIFESDSIISKIQKKAYMEAIEKHPDLVNKESDPLAFLRCEKYDPEAAAIRLVEYWKQRKSLFGQNAYKEMSLLPVRVLDDGEKEEEEEDGTSSCGSALTEEDMKILYKGHLMVLPKNSAGHAVLFFNGAPNEELPRNSVLRVWFYLLHVVTHGDNNDHVQRDGYNIINSIKGFNLSKHYDRVLGKKAYEIVKSAMPAQIRSSHAIVGKSMPTIQVVAPSSKQMAGRHIRLRAVTHTGSDQEMISSLGRYGFVSDDISDVIGGGYTREHFLQWISKQRDLEQQQKQQQRSQQQQQQSSQLLELDTTTTTNTNTSQVNSSSSSSAKIMLKSKLPGGEGTSSSTTTDESSSLSSTEESEEGGRQRVACWTGSNGMGTSSSPNNNNNNNNNNEPSVVDDHVIKDDSDNNDDDDDDEKKKKELEKEDDGDGVVAVVSSSRYNIQNEDDDDDDDEISNNNNNEASSSLGMTSTTKSSSSSKGEDVPAFYVLRC